MSVTAQEKFRVTNGNYEYVNVDFNNGEHKRNVLASEWDKDPQTVMAQVADYLANIPPEPVIVEIKNAPIITMSDREIASKLTAITEAKILETKTGDQPLSLLE